MSLFKHTPERLLLTALVGTLVSWAWSLRLLPDSPLGQGWGWALSLPAMLALSLMGCVLVSLIWVPARRAERMPSLGGADDL